MTKASKTAFVFGEAMIELSGIDDDRARLGVAGDTFNTAVYLARLGIEVQYVTALGDCAFSTRIRQACLDEGVGANHVLTVPGGTPGLYAVSVDRRGERSFTYWRGQSAARQFFAAEGWEHAFEAAASADLLYLSGITLSLFKTTERLLIFSLMKKARTEGSCVAFDPNYRPKSWSTIEAAQESISQALRLSTITLPTFDDESLLFGNESPESCAFRHSQLGGGETVVKHGAGGAFLGGEGSDGGWVLPPSVVDPLDTTGAGDSFNAGYLAARLRGDGPHDAAIAGHELAAKVLRTPGAILPRRLEIDQGS